LKLSRSQKQALLERIQELKTLSAQANELFSEYVEFLAQEFEEGQAHRRFDEGVGPITSGILGAKGFMTEGSNFDFERVDSKQLENYAEAKRYLDKLIPEAQELVQQWQAKSWLKSL